jgi:hypothetical protein
LFDYKAFGGEFKRGKPEKSRPTCFDALTGPRYQSLPGLSPAAGVTSAQYVVSETLGDSWRTLPSAMATNMPLGCGVWATPE